MVKPSRNRAVTTTAHQTHRIILPSFFIGSCLTSVVEKEEERIPERRLSLLDDTADCRETVRENRRAREEDLFDQWGRDGGRESGGVCVCGEGREFWSRVGGDVTSGNNEGGKQNTVFNDLKCELSWM